MDVGGGGKTIVHNYSQVSNSGDSEASMTMTSGVLENI